MGDAVRAFLALPSAARDALARSLTAAGASPALAAALALLVLCALAALALLGPALAMLRPLGAACSLPSGRSGPALGAHRTAPAISS